MKLKNDKVNRRTERRFFRKISKINTLLAQLTKGGKKMAKTDINKIRDERETMRNYYN